MPLVDADAQMLFLAGKGDGWYLDLYSSIETALKDAAFVAEADAVERQFRQDPAAEMPPKSIEVDTSTMPSPPRIQPTAATANATRK